jgi:hypothetical protein
LLPPANPLPPRHLNRLLQAPVRYPGGIAAFPQPPGERVDFRVTERFELLPYLRFEGSGEVGLLEQEILLGVERP